MDATGERIRKEGNEFGSTTGRPRRCGWIDLVALKYAIMLNGVTQLIMTKADVLDAFETIQVATAYKRGNEILTDFPYSLDESIEAVYTELPGWKMSLVNIRRQNEFPRELKEYINFLENILEVPIKYVSVGPDREQIIPVE
jgi:adenylosuccinate synthase